MMKGRRIQDPAGTPYFELQNAVLSLTCATGPLQIIFVCPLARA
jgi:hypothetical protein